MPCKWIQPFPDNSRCDQLVIDYTGTEPWLDVEIAKDGQSIAVIRREDLKLGQRLEVQLKMARAMATVLAPRFSDQHLRIQLHDEDPGVGCLRMDAPVGADLNSSPLIPDPYCIGTNGYEVFRKQLQSKPLPKWRDRCPMIFWRGSTTGSKDITTSNLECNLRYKLCRYSLSEPRYVDARFTNVVQCLNDKNKITVKEKLREQKLIGATVEPWHASLHAWLIDIDGNVNSWGLLWKLLSGCCVLRIMSNRQQWFHQRMIPWTHVVPVAPDLSDLDEKIDWCLRNPRHCETIASASQKLGNEIIAEINQDIYSATVRYAQYWFKK